MLQVAGAVGFGVDNLVIGHVLGPEAVTRYAVPYSLVMTGVALFGTAVTALMPTITLNFARLEHDYLGRQLLFATRLAVFYGAAATVALSIAGPSIISLWAGSGVFPGMAAFNWQLALLPLQVIIFPANAVLVATTRHYGAAALHLAESALNLSLSMWWVHRWGLSGVIAGTVVARILTTAWYVPLAAFATLHIRPKVVIRILWPAALLGVGAAAAAMSLGEYAKAAVPIPAPITAAITVMAFGLVYSFVGFSREERRRLATSFVQFGLRLQSA